MKPLLLLALVWGISFGTTGHRVESGKLDSLGKIIKRINASGCEFAAFDKDHADRAFIRDGSGMSMNVILGEPEMDCFLANHLKDQLGVNYEIRESPSAKNGRINIATRIVSLKSGDDTKTWKAKEDADSTTRARHHEQLAKVRAGRS